MKSKEKSHTSWTAIITPDTSLFDLKLGEIWHYRDLIGLFVRRDFISIYKQTVLGPLWHLIQPLFSTAVYVIFGSLANIPTDDLPRILFCLTGVVLWNYFSSCLTKTSGTFIGNAHIFGKVYFPRLIIPISVIISNLMSFTIQFLLLLPFLYFYRNAIHPNIYVVVIPFAIVLLAMMGLGLGVIVSSLTIKYRDLNYLISFAVQLTMYATPVIYPLSLVTGKFRLIADLNPLSPIFELFRYAILGKGVIAVDNLLYSTIFACVILVFGVILFNRVERNFMDTV